MFSFIKNKLQKIYSSVSQKIHSLFSTKTLSQETISELKTILLQADTGILTTN
ncbi:signal recognition particle-docking protein FtsY, partial [bacterium]|nr:signal recognition particle-docking protein FtsY [bacterium]